MEPDGSCLIDASMVPLIMALNQQGHLTGFCCSGLKREHRAKKFGISQGYIMFRDSQLPSYPLPRWLYREGGCIRMDFVATEEQRETAWAEFTSIVCGVNIP
jgi:hypothetical protein